jgi:hypothetical protein
MNVRRKPVPRDMNVPAAITALERARFGSVPTRGCGPAPGAAGT